MNNKRHCINCNCNCKFYPKKHILNQKYCSKKECQRARKKEWARYKSKHDKNYKAYRKEIQNKWKTNNPYYWIHYKKNVIEKTKQSEEALDRRINKTESKKPILKILVEKNTLANLRKRGTISYDCRLILTSQKVY